MNQTALCRALPFLAVAAAIQTYVITNCGTQYRCRYLSELCSS